MKKGPILLVSITIALVFCLVMLFRTSSRLASASVTANLVNEVLDAHERIISERETKRAGCEALGENMPVALLEICPRE